MIPVFELKAIARKNGVPESTVERDYAQNWLLLGLSKTSLKMALKGGTGIRKVYIGNYLFLLKASFFRAGIPRVSTQEGSLR